MKMRLPVLVAALLLGGCTTSLPIAGNPSAFELPSATSGTGHRPVRLRPAVPGIGARLADPHPVNDEIRIFDSRAIRRLAQPDSIRVAAYLTGPQKAAVIAGATIVGAYLISEWIEDNVAFFP